MNYITITINDTDYITDAENCVLYTDETGSHLVQIEVIEQ